MYNALWPNSGWTTDSWTPQSDCPSVDRMCWLTAPLLTSRLLTSRLLTACVCWPGLCWPPLCWPPRLLTVAEETAVQEAEADRWGGDSAEQGRSGLRLAAEGNANYEWVPPEGSTGRWRYSALPEIINCKWCIIFFMLILCLPRSLSIWVVWRWMHLLYGASLSVRLVTAPVTPAVATTTTGKAGDRIRRGIVAAESRPKRGRNRRRTAAEEGPKWAWGVPHVWAGQYWWQKTDGRSGVSPAPPPGWQWPARQTSTPYKWWTTAQRQLILSPSQNCRCVTYNRILQNTDFCTDKIFASITFSVWQLFRYNLYVYSWIMNSAQIYKCSRTNNVHVNEICHFSSRRIMVLFLTTAALSSCCPLGYGSIARQLVVVDWIIWPKSTHLMKIVETEFFMRISGGAQ